MKIEIKPQHTLKSATIEECQYNHSSAEITGTQKPIATSAKVGDSKDNQSKFASNVERLKSKKIGGELKVHSSKPMEVDVPVAGKVTLDSSRSIISSETDLITAKKAVADGGYMNGSQSKDIQKTDTDSSATTVIVHVGNTENVRISCPTKDAAFIVRAVNFHQVLLNIASNLHYPVHKEKDEHCETCQTISLAGGQ